MIRRSFRIGLTLGLLGGLAFALAKMFGPRPEPRVNHAPATTDPWPRLQPDMARPSPPAVAMVPEPVAPEPRVSSEEPRVAPAPPVTPPPVVEEAEAPRPAPRPPAAKAAPARKSPVKAATKKAPAKKKAAATAWVAPKGDVCPTTHPVKAKLTSKIFHLPGMLNYARTHPDRCYRDAKTAEADGLRRAKK